jgi:hypothetical protein
MDTHIYAAQFSLAVAQYAVAAVLTGAVALSAWKHL